MTRIANRLCVSIACFGAAFMLQTAHAEQAPVTATPPHLSTLQLPYVDRQALVEAVQTLRSQLIEHKRVLLQRVADGKLDGNDALITAIMPGGLLYAGYKKIRLAQASNELAGVNADIEELSGDLLALQSISTPVVVAQLP